MSWSFSCVGKPAAVLKAADDQFSRVKCAEPEETLRQQALESIKKSLSMMPDSTAVQVDACGSQYSLDVAEGKPGFINTFKLEIKPLYGFVE